MTSKKNILTVSQLSYKIREALESEFSSVWIQGEISNFVVPVSGHWYFSLKDENSQIKGAMFKGSNERVSFRPKNGEELLIKGKLSVYAPRGDYQIICQEMERLGSGMLQQQFEELKQKLKKEGLFDASRKRPLPLFPKKIAVITSETGAALRDILQILDRRFKAVEVLLIPALVQGEQAPSSLLRALELSKNTRAEVVIIGRGGGSMEDLWAFNNEALARAISQHPVPVISAVGHEIDFTICDFVADLRAPTPSASAELVVKNAAELLEKLDQFQKQFEQNFNLQISFLSKRLEQFHKYLEQAIYNQITHFKNQLKSFERSLTQPLRAIQDFSQKLDETSVKYRNSIQTLFEDLKRKLAHFEQILSSLDHQKILKRGFALLSDSKGVFISSVKQIKLNEELSVQLSEGSAKVKVLEKEKD